MGEFLSTNRTIQTLDQFTPESLWVGVLGTLHQFQQQQQSRVLAIRRAELVPSAIAHLHAVLKLEQSLGGMGWLLYNWKSGN